MQIEFEVDGQRLTRVSDAYLVEGSERFVECVFDFSNDWDELDKWAIFRRDKDTFEIHVTDDRCLVPVQCTESEGEFSIALVGRKGEYDIISTTSTKLLIVRPSKINPTGSFLGDVLTKVKDAETNVLEARKHIDQTDYKIYVGNTAPGEDITNAEVWINPDEDDSTPEELALAVIQANTSAENAMKAAEMTESNKDIAVEAANDAANSQKLVEKYKALWFNSVSAMKAEKSLKPGATACTLGYYSPNDGGAGTYIIRAKADGDVDDGGSLHELANGNVAELVVENGTVNVKQFGAKGDGVTDDSDVIQTTLNAANNAHCKVFFSKGAYIISKEIVVPRALKIRGVNEQWPSKEYEEGKFETGTQLNLKGNGTLTLEGYVDLANLTIYGTKAEVGLTMEDRCYIHDLSFMYLLIGISNNTKSSNLTRFERISITNCNTAISLQANNQKNSQSISFRDIDIRGCLYGYVSDQPSNKFYNFCVQTGSAGGVAIHLLDGAVNNVFYGSYLESTSYEYEIICEKGASYNKFLGGRIYTYSQTLNDKDGTNIISCKSTQYANTNFVKGNVMFSTLGIAGGTSYKNNPPWCVHSSADDSSITLGVSGTSAKKFFKLDNSLILHRDILTQGMYIRHSLPYCGIYIKENSTILSKQQLTIEVNYSDRNSDMVFVNCISHSHVLCNAKLVNSRKFIITLYNCSNTDIVDETISFSILTFLKGA